jgi:hypothetical protein
MLVRALVIATFFSLGLTGVRVSYSRDNGLFEQASVQANVQPETKSDGQIERLLRALEGTWSITDELAPDASSPKGKTGAGTIIWRPGPGGYSVVEEFRSKQGDMDVTGLGMFWWDEVARGYHTIWCDSTNPGGCIDFKNPAKWEGSSLVLQEDYELHGKKYTFREVFGDITSESFTQTLYGGEAGGSLKVDETIHARKRKAS